MQEIQATLTVTVAGGRLGVVDSVLALCLAENARSVSGLIWSLVKGCHLARSSSLLVRWQLCA
jgi:hypothetical protein